MNPLDDTTIIDEVFHDDNCSDERAGTEWFRPRVVFMADFLEHREAGTESETVIRKTAPRTPFFENNDGQVIVAKERELFISMVGFLVLCLAAIVVIFLGGSPLFWTPIALGSFGVCGSSALYFRRLRFDYEQTERIRSYG